MISKVVIKMYAFWWNALFVLLGVLLIGILHAHISQLVSFCVNEVSLIEEVEVEKEFQKFGATKVTRSGKLIVQSYDLGTVAALKQKEAQSNVLIIALLVITLPFLLAITYTLFSKASVLAVNRNWCLAIITACAIVGIFYVELLSFIEGGNGSGFLFSALPSVQLSFLFSFFVSIQPKEKLSPYYRSRTELLDEVIPVAA
jgi:hypothetical protein